MTRFLLLGLCLLLSACGLGRTPPPDYYVLTVGAEPLPGDTTLDGPRVALGPLTLPGYLDRNALILHSSGKTQADVVEQAAWSEPIADGVSRVLCDSLSRRLRPTQGMAFPLRAAIPASWRVSVDMSRLDGEPGGTATLEAGWTLTAVSSPVSGNAGDHEVVAMGHFVDTMPAGETLSSFVFAQSQLLDRFGAALAREVLRAEAKKH